MSRHWRLPCGEGALAVTVTEVADGDFAVGADPVALQARRAGVAPGRWTWLRQAHGAGVVVVAEPGAGCGEAADAAVSTHPGAVLSVTVADCAPVALAGDNGAFGVVHAGWRGLVGGVVEAAAAALRALGAGSVRAVAGPCIHPSCYEFGPDDLDRVAARFGDGVRARTRAGSPALDLPGALRAALARAGVDLAARDDRCTACAAGILWSHRARRDEARFALVARLGAP